MADRQSSRSLITSSMFRLVRPPRPLSSCSPRFVAANASSTGTLVSSKTTYNKTSSCRVTCWMNFAKNVSCGHVKLNCHLVGLGCRLGVLITGRWGNVQRTLSGARGLLVCILQLTHQLLCTVTKSHLSVSAVYYGLCLIFPLLCVLELSLPALYNCNFCMFNCQCCCAPSECSPCL